ncbi:MAG: glucosaminidase domain-containing protein [Labilithrix sp.]|nr:glucosaminidase domain-containing protein [Labilithrix sp.]
MRVGANAVPTASVERSRRIEVEPQRTPVSRAELRGAIGRAHQKLTGRAASASMLDVLTAHASLETGSGSRMYNYNFGGIKGAGPTGETARCLTREVEGGREIEIRDGFRAYRSLDEGAVDYVRLMRDRFGGAVARAEAGDVDGFAHALKQARYYTADESKYASALRGLAGVPEAASASAATPRREVSSAAAVFPDSFELGRVLDAIARHPRTIEDIDGEDD